MAQLRDTHGVNYYVQMASLHNDRPTLSCVGDASRIFSGKGA